MPYKDPAKRRASTREAVRRHRAGERKTAGKPLPELAELRYHTARDVLELLGDQVTALLADEALGTVERARAVGYLAGLLLRAVEAADVTERLEALEAALELREVA